MFEYGKEFQSLSSILPSQYTSITIYIAFAIYSNQLKMLSHSLVWIVQSFEKLIDNNRFE